MYIYDIVRTKYNLNTYINVKKKTRNCNVLIN